MAQPLAVTMGDPAGIGVEVTLKAWVASHETGPAFFVIADPDFVASRVRQLGLNVPLSMIDAAAQTADNFRKSLPIMPIRLPEPVILGHANPAHGETIIQSIEIAVDLAKKGEIDGFVTAPINKANLYRAGFIHPGHTEYLGALDNGAKTLMMLANQELRVVPLTVHEPLKAVPRLISTHKIVRAARLLDQSLKRDFGLQNPRIMISGLNPHAGEEGEIGNEELMVIQPAIGQLKSEGLNVLGPGSPDGIFHQLARQQYDVALCMYHDQALIPVKTLDFFGTTNITLGLSFVRTSPDHGTAFDIAPRGIAIADSMVNALKQAQLMAQSRRDYDQS